MQSLFKRLKPVTFTQLRLLFIPIIYLKIHENNTENYYFRGTTHDISSNPPLLSDSQRFPEKLCQV